jgi:hypothetical protein
VLFLIAILLAACSGGGGGGGGGAPTAATAVIDSAGGTLTGPDGVQVVVPAGALDQPTVIGIARSAAGAPAALDAYPVAGNIYELTPHDLLFNLPVTIRMPVPSGASGSVFMASPGQDWNVKDATVVNGVAEWERTSFSWMYWSSWKYVFNHSVSCSIPTSMLNDPYWCGLPVIGVSISATPPQALTRTLDINSIVYFGRVDQAATLHFQSQVYVPGNCGNVTVELRRRRWNGSTMTWGPPQTISTQHPALTVDGSQLSGAATFDFSFTYQDNGKNDFEWDLSTDCPGILDDAHGNVVGWDYGHYHTTGAFQQTRVEGNIAPPTVFYTVGGAVSGLTGTGLVLHNNGGDNLAVTANGAFTFAASVGAGSPYNVTVFTQPTGQTCVVTNGSGTIAGANVTNVAIACANAAYTLGGTVAGLSGTGLVLQNNGGDNLAVSANGNFTFAASLADGASYAVTVLTQPSGSAQTCKVTNGSGTIAGANVTNVTVNCKAWGAAARIESGVRDAYAPQMAMDASGNAFAVWRQDYTDPSSGYSGYVVWANRYTNGSGWGTAAIINNGYMDSGYPPLYAQIAMDANGNAIAVWEQYNPGSFGGSNISSIWANRYTAGMGWGTAAVIQNDVSSTQSAYPQVAMDANGNAIAVWLQYSTHVWATRYTVGSGWGTAVRIDSLYSSAFPSPPQLAMDANGNAFAVWPQGGAIIANRYTAGTGWGTAADIVVTSGGYAVQIAMNDNGVAFVVWGQYDSTSSSFSVWSKRYIAGWQPDVQIGFNLNVNRAPQIAINAAGDGFAVWSQFDGTSYHIYTARHSAATTWDATVRIDSDTGSAGSPQIAVDANGDAFAVWYQFDGMRYNIWSNRRLAADMGWGTAELIETDNAGSAYDPQVVVDPNGNALSVWRQNDGTRYNIWANSFK